MPKLTIEQNQLTEFLSLEAERKALEQKARAIAKRTDALKAHFKTFLGELDKQSVTRHGFRITIVDGRPSVSWKDEFIRVAGPIAADDVLTSAPKSKGVEVTPL